MTLEFKNAAHQFVYEKVRAYISESYEGFWSDERTPAFRLIKGSALAIIQVLPLWDNDALVRVVSYVVQGANIKDPELLMYLLRKNSNVTFGAFGIDGDGDIFFDHTLVGTSLDRDQLNASINWVLGVADDHDDEIMGTWGGRRAIDLSTSELPGMDFGDPGPEGFPRIRRDPEHGRFTVRDVVEIAPVIALIEEDYSDEAIIAEHTMLAISDLDEVRRFLREMDQLARKVDVNALVFGSEGDEEE